MKDKLLLKADGKEDYYTKFDNILQSFIERKVHGCHTLSSQADFNLHHDGYKWKAVYNHKKVF